MNSDVHAYKIRFDYPNPLISYNKAIRFSATLCLGNLSDLA
jgi:hypothetical protein